MGRGDLPDMYTWAQGGGCSAQGECGHIRQITTAHVTYVTFINLYLRVIINCGNNIPMCNHNIPMEIPHSNEKLYHILIQSCSTLREVVSHSIGKLYHSNTTCSNVSYSGPLI